MSWAELAAWRTDGQAWKRAAPDLDRIDAHPMLVCRCGRTAPEHDPTRKGAPAVAVLGGAILCPGLDPVARVRAVTYLERQDSRRDRLNAQPPDA